MFKPISNPKLPPKLGYVEVEVNGMRQYKKVEDDPVNSLADENKMLSAQIQALTDRNEFLEDCVAEMATMVYA